MIAPLKVTTDYTLLKSLIKIPDLIKFLQEHNIKVCGICDENLYGVLDFYQKCKNNDIKPIIGLSIRLNDLDVYLYAKNYKGYQNLLKIHTIIHEREISVFDLQKYKDNIIVILPFKSHELYQTLAFYEIVYIGYQNKYEKSNALLITSKVVFVNDIRVLKMEDIKYMTYLDLLRKVNNQEYHSNYYLDGDEESAKEINEFASFFSLEIPHDKRYIPKYNENSLAYLEALAKKGLTKRLNNKLNATYVNRLNYELDVIKKMGYVDYFLIVYDYVLYAKKNHILTGCRGSAAGSLVSYCLGITDIDPIPYNLLFERFLNPERISMPDIDIDIDATKRDDIISYVKSKYGSSYVAAGITFNSLKSKLVLREIGKLLKINPSLLDKFVREIDGSLKLKDNLVKKNVQTYLKNYQELAKLYEISLKLEGLKKNVSTHAAGVVISSVVLDEVIPIYKNNDVTLTGVTMEYLEDLGLLKMDFLGLKNLTSIANILKRIPEINLNNLNLEDANVYNLFKSGKTEGIFQFETPAMKALLLKLKPDSFKDLIAAIALGRPGPKDHADSFIRRKKHLEKVSYLHPDLEPILKETYGILLYQEQIIAVLGKIGGYSYGEADVIRRAISKKKEEVLKEEAKNFITRAINKGYKKELAEEIYSQIVKFAGYGFNKSHSVAYALLAYQMAYLKTYYSAYFVLELLNNAGDFKNNYYFAYLKQKGIIFYKPSINNDNFDYEIKDNKLMLPLRIIKNITSEVAKKIILAKGNGYQDFFDFCLKTKDFINENILKSLIDAGAFSQFELNHQTLEKNIDSALNYAELADINSNLVKKPTIVMYPEYNDNILREKELASLGFYLSNHPASKYLKDNIIKINKIDKYLFKKVNMVCLIESIKTFKTKNGDDMAFLSASDETGIMDFTVFPKNFNYLKNIKKNDLVNINGEVTKRFDKIQVVINMISKLEG